MKQKPAKTDDKGGGSNLAFAAAAAGVGLLAGLAARAGARGLVVAAEPLGGHWLDIIKGDHLIIQELFERALASKATAKAKRVALLGRIKEALVRHAVEEETVLYPALRFADAAEASARLSGEHAEVKAQIYDLERTPADDPAWHGKLATLYRELEDHMRREEEEIFPAFRRGLTPEEDVRLTQLVNIEGRRFG